MFDLSVQEKQDEDHRNNVKFLMLMTHTILEAVPLHSLFTDGTEEQVHNWFCKGGKFGFDLLRNIISAAKTCKDFS